MCVWGGGHACASAFGWRQPTLLVGTNASMHPPPLPPGMQVERLAMQIRELRHEYSAVLQHPVPDEARPCVVSELRQVGGCHGMSVQ